MNRMKGMKDKFVTNQNGIRIRVCCVSCEHCKFGEAVDSAGDFRSCLLDGERPSAVRPTDHCKSWMLASQFIDLKLSKEPGPVKRREYLQLVSEVRKKECEEKATTCMSIEEMRAQYESEHHQSVYMSM